MNYVGEDIMTQNVIFDLSSENYKQAFSQIAKRISEDTGLDKDALYDSFLNAEKSSTSGIGDGVAIPQLRLPMIKEPYILVVKLNRSIDFHAVDEKPVDIMVVVLSPQREEAHQHLQRLARITRRARDEDIIDTLRNADCEDAMRIIFFASEEFDRALAA